MHLCTYLSVSSQLSSIYLCIYPFIPMLITLFIHLPTSSLIQLSLSLLFSSISYLSIIYRSINQSIIYHLSSLILSICIISNHSYICSFTHTALLHLSMNHSVCIISPSIQRSTYLPIH